MPAPAVSSPSPVATRPPRPAREHGSQATEYALLLIVAATVAVLLLNWARSDSGVPALLDTIVGEVLNLFGIG